MDAGREKGAGSARRRGSVYLYQYESGDPHSQLPVGCPSALEEKHREAPMMFREIVPSGDDAANEVCQALEAKAVGLYGTFSSTDNQVLPPPL